MLLQIKNLGKCYGGVHALDDVSLSLDAGTVLGLVGDNGAGKSTLMKCITGAEHPDRGTIIFNGQDLNKSDPHYSRLSGIEMIYQNLDLCLQQDAVTNIFLGRETLINIEGIKTPLLNTRAMYQAAKDIIERLSVSINVKKTVGALSGGQQQAVAIARALLSQPKLLIMDEPTAALGVTESARVLELIKSLKSQEMAVIIISHRLSDIFEVADRVILMRHGKICEDRYTAETSLNEMTQKIIGV